MDHDLNKLEITLHDDACFFGQNGFREEFLNVYIFSIILNLINYLYTIARILKRDGNVKILLR